MNTRSPLARRSGIAALALAAGLLAAACGGGSEEAAGSGSGSGSGDARGTTVLTKEFAFDPASLTLSAGEVSLTVDNSRGVVEHDFTVDELDIAVHADAGKKTTETVTLAAGTYEFYCSIPGHKESGMTGSLTVR